MKTCAPWRPLHWPRTSGTARWANAVARLVALARLPRPEIANARLRAFQLFELRHTHFESRDPLVTAIADTLGRPMLSSKRGDKSRAVLMRRPYSKPIGVEVHDRAFEGPVHKPLTTQPDRIALPQGDQCRRLGREWGSGEADSAGVSLICMVAAVDRETAPRVARVGVNDPPQPGQTRFRALGSVVVPSTNPTTPLKWYIDIDIA